MSQLPLGKETLAILQILSAGILWGLVGPLVKMMELHGSTAASTSFIRMLFAFLIMTAFTAMKFGPKALIVDKRTLVACAVSNGIYNMFYTMAIANAGIAVSAVLLNTAPIFTTVFSMLIFHEGISLLKVIALCINVVGCSLAATGGQLNLETLSVLGVSCGIASGFTYGMAAIITRIAGSATNTYVMSAYSYLFATISVLILFQPWTCPESYNAATIGYGFLLALIPTSLAYLLYYKGILKMKETSKVPIIASVEMIATAIISVVFFGEHLSPAAIFGIMLVVASIALLSVRISARHR